MVSARFKVDDPSPPVGGLTGGATDAQTVVAHYDFRLNGADIGGGLVPAVVEVTARTRLGLR